MIRKYSYETIQQHTPADHQRLLINIRKLKEQAKAKKKKKHDPTGEKEAAANALKVSQKKGSRFKFGYLYPPSPRAPSFF